MSEYDAIIIGAGPAGLTAGLFCARAGLKTLIVERSMIGGRMVEAPLIDNYPGFPEPVRGVELAQLMYNHAIKAGAEIIYPEEIVDLIVGSKHHRVVTRLGKNYRSLAIIIATGLNVKKGTVINEEKLIGKGVSYCAVCDGPLFKGKKVALVGSSYRALNEALFLTGIASKVYVILHEKPEEEAYSLLRRIERVGNAIIIEGKATKIIGKNYVEGIEVEYSDGRKEIIDVSGIFISVGEVPTTQIFRKIGIKLDERGFIVTSKSQETNIPGIFAAGDVTGQGLQIATAVGQGAMAALSAIRYVRLVKSGTM